MNSPPPPSFTLPPLKSNGQYPVTPDDSPNADDTGDVAKDYLSAKSRGKGKERAMEIDEVVPEVRVSMYVRLFEGKPKRHSQGWTVQRGYNAQTVLTV